VQEASTRTESRCTWLMQEKVSDAADSGRLSSTPHTHARTRLGVAALYPHVQRLHRTVSCSGVHTFTSLLPVIDDLEGARLHDLGGPTSMQVYSGSEETILYIRSVSYLNPRNARQAVDSAAPTRDWGTRSGKQHCESYKSEPYLGKSTQEKGLSRLNTQQTL
jgi:hypothetical protein